MLRKEHNPGLILQQFLRDGRRHIRDHTVLRERYGILFSLFLTDQQ